MPMSRTRRRALERALDKLIKRDGDHCSVCRAEFSHRAATAYGTIAGGAVVIVGICCVRKLTSVLGFGVYLKKDGRVAADMAKRAGMPAAATSGVLYGEYPWKSDDREWFAANPGRAHRLRPCFPGERGGDAEPWDEVPPPVGRELLVLVRQIEPGKRVRICVDRPPDAPIPDAEPILQAMFDLVAAGYTHGADRFVIGDAEVDRLAREYAAGYAARVS